MHWILSHTVSRSPSQRAMVACGSIGLWLLRAIAYRRSETTGGGAQRRVGVAARVVARPACPASCSACGASMSVSWRSGVVADLDQGRAVLAASSVVATTTATG